MPNHPQRSNLGQWPSPTPEQWRELRDQHGLTQTQAGELVCTQLRTVQRWEAGTARIPPMAWELLRIKLGIANA
jgi:DNA-binding transcriptional regulator YiaG